LQETEIETVEDDVPIADVAEAASGGSPETNLLEALSAKREELAEIREVDIPIRGYESTGLGMYARYRLVDGEEIADIGRKVMREFRKNQQYERNLYASIDLMISACTGIWVEADGSKFQLTLEGVPIGGYDGRLAEALSFDAPTARQVVIGTFANNVMALQTHSLLLGRWMSDTSTDVMSEMLEGNL
jgi:hypothetical protein